MFLNIFKHGYLMFIGFGNPVKIWKGCVFIYGGVLKRVSNKFGIARLINVYYDPLSSLTPDVKLN